MPDKHAVLSASSAHRWLECPPSAQLNARSPDQSNIFAEEGTLAHAIGELTLRLAKKEISKVRFNNELEKLKKTTYGDRVLFYQGMIDEVEEYTNYVLERFNEYKTADQLAELYIEQTLDYSEYAPEGFGTGDAVIVSKDVLHIIDLKFGKTEVDPEENPQLKLYALGGYEAFGFLHDFKTVRATIVQPRLNGISTFETDPEAIVAWGNNVVKPIAKQAIEGLGEFKPGPHCKYCKISAQCKARANHYKGIYERSKDNTLSAEELSELLKVVKPMQDWAKELEVHALEEALAGTEIPGWKVVEGRSNRTITNEQGFADILLKDYLEEQIYKPKAMYGITELTKLVGKKTFDVISGPYITKPPGKPTLAPASDPRPPMTDITDELQFDK